MDIFVSHIQARQAAGGPTPPLTPENEIKDQTRELLAVVGFLYGIALAAVLLRIWVRTRVLKAFGPDDYLMCIAALFSTACLIAIANLTKYGLGKQVEILSYHPDWMLPLFAWLYFYSIFVIFAYSFIKLSIGFFLLRLAQRTKYRPILIGILVFLVLFTIGSTLAIILQCKPVAAGWNLALREPMGKGTCYPIDIFRKVGVFNSSINIATDLLFAILPIPMVWKLQVNIRTKIGLVSILSLGFFAAATAIYKTPMQYHFFEQPDFTGKGAWYYVWQIVEMNIGIVAACLPTLKPLFITFFEKARALTSNHKTRRTGRSHDAAGYYKQEEPSSMSLSNLVNSKSGYKTQVVSMHVRPCDDDAEEPTYGQWPTHGKGKDTDEEPLNGHERPLPTRNRGIMQTREVYVS